MELLLDNWEMIIAGLGSGIGIGGVLWGRRVIKTIKAWTNVAITVIDAHSDGKYTEEEIRQIIDETGKALATLFPFVRKYRLK